MKGSPRHDQSGTAPQKFAEGRRGALVAPERDLRRAEARTPFPLLSDRTYRVAAPVDRRRVLAAGTDTAAITVTLNNLNDNAPDIIDATVALDENSANSTAVTNISDSFTATDFDRDGEAITYSITAGNTGGAFAINAARYAINT